RTGDDQPRPGTSTFHATFVSGPHFSGRAGPVYRPSPSGPRNSIQSPADAADVPTRQNKTASRMAGPECGVEGRIYEMGMTRRRGPPTPWAAIRGASGPPYSFFSAGTVGSFDRYDISRFNTASGSAGLTRR